MAKGDKQDVTKAKSASTKNKISKANRKTLESNIKKMNTDRKLENRQGNAGSKVTKQGSKVSKVNINRNVAQSKMDPWGARGVPSVPTKTGAKNKMKAQGAKINSSATSNYNRRSK
jgi:hypothetical protein